MPDRMDELQKENARLKAYIRRLEAQNGGAPQQQPGRPHSPAVVAPSGREWDGAGHGLSADQVGRYSRQIILPSFGVQGEKELRSAQ